MTTQAMLYRRESNEQFYVVLRTVEATVLSLVFYNPGCESLVVNVEHRLTNSDG